MHALTQFLRRRLTSDASDRRWGQAVCFAAALAVLCCGAMVVARLAATEFEVAVGLFAAAAVSVSFVTLGVVLGSTATGRVER